MYDKNVAKERQHKKVYICRCSRSETKVPIMKICLLYWFLEPSINYLEYIASQKVLIIIIYLVPPSR